MTAIPPDTRTRRNAIRHEAIRRAMSWVAFQPPGRRPFDHLATQIAPALGREYLSLSRRGTSQEPTGAAGRKQLAKSVLKRLVSAGVCETHTDSDGQQSFTRVGFSLPTATKLPVPTRSHLTGDTVIAVRDLAVGDHQEITAVGNASDNPWRLPDPIEVVAGPNGRGVVALAGKTVVGYAAYEVDSKMVNGTHAILAEVVRLTVAEQWQRRGIATLLLQAAEDRVICEAAAECEKGYILMDVTVPEPCLPVLLMCKGLGYAALDDAIRRDMFEGVDGYRLIRFTKWQIPQTLAT